MAVIYGIYQSMNYMGADFVIPAVSLAGTVRSLVICAGVPVMAYREIEKKGIVEYIYM